MSNGGSKEEYNFIISPLHGALRTRTGEEEDDGRIRNMEYEDGGGSSTQPQNNNHPLVIGDDYLTTLQ